MDCQISTWYWKYTESRLVHLPKKWSTVLEQIYNIYALYHNPAYELRILKLPPHNAQKNGIL